MLAPSGVAPSGSFAAASRAIVTYMVLAARLYASQRVLKKGCSAVMNTSLGHSLKSAVK